MTEDLQSAIGTLEEAMSDVAQGNLRRRLPPSESLPESLRGLADSMSSVIAAWRASELRSRQIKRSLEEKIAKVEAQAVAIRELSTPILQVAHGVLLLPVVGAIDEERSAAIMEEVLERVVTSQAVNVIVDITGVEDVDERIADHLVKLVRATRLVGANCILTGMSPAVAQTLIAMGADLAEIRTLRTLEQGIVEVTR